MSWIAIKQNAGGDGPKIKYIYDGLKVIDATIFFGKYCIDRDVGINLSEIAMRKGGCGYIRWLSEGFAKSTDELIEACEEVLSRYDTW